jgi:hypothetical protein
MKEIFRKLLFGDAVIREYSTVRIGDEIRERVYLQIGAGERRESRERSERGEQGEHSKRGERILDVSACHWVLCLDPIVFGVWVEKGRTGAFDEKAPYKMYFRDEAWLPGADPAKNAIATLQVDFLNKIEEAKGSLFLFRLDSCRIHPISSLKTWLLYYKYYKKPGLSFQKLKSFVAAYSYPRRVRIISFRDEDYYNIFPMDLLGDIRQAGRFVFGLRHTNRTLSRIIEAKKILVSEVPFGYKDSIYQLGSHHSASPPSLEVLPFGVLASPDFKFWIPEWAESCKEIRILQTMNLGSHMLLWGEPVNETFLKPASDHLHHIHFLLYLRQKSKGLSYPLA